MEKKIEGYLHLYIGCECILNANEIDDIDYRGVLKMVDKAGLIMNIILMIHVMVLGLSSVHYLI